MALLILVVAAYCVLCALNVMKNVGAGLFKLAIPVIGTILMVLAVIVLFG